jgi:4-hydroxy-tetrahydrodipicolinate synthase
MTTRRPLRRSTPSLARAARKSRGRDRIDWSGLWVALATPFDDGGGLDLDALRRLVRRCRDGGVQGLVALGTTGEAGALADDERDLVVDAVRAEADRLPVVVGVGSSSTRQAEGWMRRAAERGADGALLVTPAYVKPNPEGLVAHYRAVAAAAPALPIVAYNVPGRTGFNLTPPLAARLWEIPGVVALKESSGDLAQIDAVARQLPRGRTLLAGDDHLALPAIAVGASGLVSVVGNVAPRTTRALVDAARAGRLAEARRLHAALAPLVAALFAESSPVPLKAALALVGAARDGVRPPLAPASEATRRRLAEALAGLAEIERVAA